MAPSNGPWVAMRDPTLLNSCGREGVPARRGRCPDVRRIAAALLALAMSGALSCASAAGRGEVRPQAAHQPYRLAPQALPSPQAHAQAGVDVERAPAERAQAGGAGAAAVAAARGGDLEAALEWFVSAQSAARQPAAVRPAISEQALLRWSELFGAVDRALTMPAREISPLTFVRLRAVLESEMELDLLHYGTLPPWLPIALRARLLGIEQKLAQHRALTSRPARAPAADFRWPLESPIVTSLFGMRRDPFTGEKRFHRGVDLRARTRQRVEAIAGGTVTRAAQNGGYGLSVEILHDGGFTSTYSHLSLLLVRQNDRVAAGDPIGLTGNTGRSTASHLHFELWKGSRAVDPLDFLPAPEILRAARQ